MIQPFNVLEVCEVQQLRDIDVSIVLSMLLRFYILGILRNMIKENKTLGESLRLSFYYV